MLYTAFIFGLIGSLHCVGMCGPLTLLLPQQASSNIKFISGRVLYNFGRITTYVLLGIVIGYVGQRTELYISQKWLSIGLGVAIILGLLFYRSIIPANWVIKLNSSFNRLVSRALGKRKSFYFSQFSFGLVNGLLPCGMIYAALSGAFLQLHIWEGGLYMLLFGLGTFPLMLSASLGFGWLKSNTKVNFAKLVPISYALVAIWLIIRGVSDYSASELSLNPAENIIICETK